MTNSELRNCRVGWEIKHYTDRNDADKKQASKVLDRVIGMLVSAKKELDDQGYVRVSAIWNSVSALNDVDRLFSKIDAREDMLGNLRNIIHEEE